MTLGDQRVELALAGQRILELQPRKLDLDRPRRGFEVVENPVVERAMIFEFERAKRMGDALDRIRQAVGEIVQRVDTPVVAGIVMGDVPNPVQHRVAHLDVGRIHVDLRAQHVFAVGVLVVFHRFEQLQIFLDAAVAVGALATGFGQRAAVGADVVGALAVDIGLALLDQIDREVVQLAEVIRSERVAVPFETEPLDVAPDRVDVLLFLFFRVGIVETQVAVTVVIARDAEIEANRLGVPDMQVTVGLRRESSDDGIHLAGGEVGVDDIADEIGTVAGFSAGIGHWVICIEIESPDFNRYARKAESVYPIVMHSEVASDHRRMMLLS